MKVTIRLILLAQLLGVAFGLCSELSPNWLPATWRVPHGMGIALAQISAVMGVTLLVVEHERQEREADRNRQNLWDSLAERMAIALPVHEREFYSLWPAQVAMAQHNIDVTHLGRRPPHSGPGKEESKYISDFRRLYKNSDAIVRRVERATPEKSEWIAKLVEDFRGAENFSLRLYKDPSDGDMPFALSVSRVDDRYAWIVAAAEQESTSSVRDLMLTGRDSVELVRKYFQERLWARSIVVIERGLVNDSWKEQLKL